MLDPSILLQAKGIATPDPLALAQQGLSLAELAGRGQIQQYALKNQQRNDNATQALGQILPGLQAGGYSDAAVQQALQHPLVLQNPDVAVQILNTANAQRKAQAGAEKDAAVAAKDRQEARVKGLTAISGDAFRLSQMPGDLAPMDLQRVAANMKFLGVPLESFGAPPADQEGARSWLASIAAGGMDAAKQAEVQTQLAGQKVTMRGQDIGANTAANEQKVQIRGQNMTAGTAAASLNLRKQEADPFGMMGINPNAPKGGMGAAGASGPSGADFLQTLPGPVADQVKALAEGRMAFPGSFALKSPYWQTMLSAVAQYDPSFDAVNYNARSKTRNDFTSGKSAQSLNALNTVAGHLQTLSDAADKLNNFGGVATPLNAPINAVESALGDPRQKNFDIARKTVADEMVRAYRAAGGSEKDIQEWMRLLNSSGSPAQLHSNIAQVSVLLDSKIQALGEQYKQGMGTTSQPIQLVTPKARATFDLLESRKGGGASPAPAKTSDSLPDPSSLPDGAVVTDTSTGRKLTVSGGKYTQ